MLGLIKAPMRHEREKSGDGVKICYRFRTDSIFGFELEAGTVTEAATETVTERQLIRGN